MIRLIKEIPKKVISVKASSKIASLGAALNFGGRGFPGMGISQKQNSSPDPIIGNFGIPGIIQGPPKIKKEDTGPAKKLEIAKRTKGAQRRAPTKFANKKRAEESLGKFNPSEPLQSQEKTSENQRENNSEEIEIPKNSEIPELLKKSNDSVNSEKSEKFSLDPIKESETELTNQETLGKSEIKIESDHKKEMEINQEIVGKEVKQIKNLKIENESEITKLNQSENPESENIKLNQSEITESEIKDEKKKIKE